MQKFYLNIESEPQEEVLLRGERTELERSSLKPITDRSPGRTLSDQSVLFPNGSWWLSLKKLEYLEYGQALRWTGDVTSSGHGDEEKKEEEEYISLDCAVLLLSEQNRRLNRTV